MCKKILVFLILLVSACNTLPTTPSGVQMTTAKTHLTKNVFEMGNRGVIILQVKNSRNLENYLDFYNSQETFNFYTENDGVQIYMLPPGTYSLNKLYLYKRTINGNYATTSKLDLTNTLRTSFEVKAGDVVYLGELNVNIGGSRNTNRNFFTGSSRSEVLVKVNIEDKFSSISEKRLEFIKANTNNANIKTILLKVDK